jgi:hypothetical protein
MSNINNLLNAKNIAEIRKATTAVRNHKLRIKAKGIHFVKTSSLFILLPNNRVSVAPKIQRATVNLTYAGCYSVKNKATIYVNDNDHEFSPYKSLAKTLEIVKEQLLCGKMTLPSFFDRVTDKGRAGVCFDEKRWVVFKNKYNEDLRNLKVKKEYFKTQAVAEQYAAKIVDQNKEYLLAMMDKHIHLLRTDPNALPLYNEDIHGKIVVLDTTEQEKQQ